MNTKKEIAVSTLKAAISAVPIVGSIVSEVLFKTH